MSQESDPNMEDHPVRQPVRNVPDLNMQALLREMERLLDRRLNPLEDRLFQVKAREQRERTPEVVRPRRREADFNFESFREDVRDERYTSSRAPKKIATERSSRRIVRESYVNDFSFLNKMIFLLNLL